MGRIFTPAMAAAIKRGAPRVLLVYVDHPAGAFRGYTGIPPLEWDGHTWTGFGRLGRIEPIKSTTDLVIQEIRFRMSGVDAETLALLDDSVRGRLGRVWLGCLDEDGKIVPDPWDMLRARLDYPESAPDDSGKFEFSIIARSGLWSLERALNETWSPEDQRSRFSTDVGLDQLPSLENNQVDWTKESQDSNPVGQGAGAN